MGWDRILVGCVIFFSSFFSLLFFSYGVAVVSKTCFMTGGDGGARLAVSGLGVFDAVLAARLYTLCGYVLVTFVCMSTFYIRHHPLSFLFFFSFLF